MHFKFWKERAGIRRCCTQAAELRVIPAFHHHFSEKKQVNDNFCTTITYWRVTEFTASRNWSTYLRKSHQEIVATSAVSLTFMQNVKSHLSAPSAGGRARSHVNPCGMESGKSGTGTNFFPPITSVCPCEDYSSRTP
jgi:hypothetical protein